jgi:hypothetical protein
MPVLHVVHVIFALIRVTYQFANDVKIYIIELIKPHTNMVSFFPKCRCFSLAQCCLWWWRKPAENTECGAVISHGDTTSLQSLRVELGFFQKSYIRSAHPRRLKVIGHR